MTYKQVFNGLLWYVLGRIWNPTPGWKMQEVEKYNFVFSFTTRKEVNYILENRPWSPCNRFLVIREMPNDILWGSIDLSITSLWVRAYGFPVKFMTDKNAAKVAARTRKGTGHTTYL
ncbi:hypothetical protein PanWU01x14_240200 [Parasponia andersonii]|uniref:Uncharacterized protein n=1 Tax=Parasponia andersonii TaxID=3476 RepID=A0A2P5BGW9_PARAD|nr:hypothetical protein PanWU01x14_240200 [Parasponia andersonii]